MKKTFLDKNIRKQRKIIVFRTSNLIFSLMLMIVFAVIFIFKPEIFGAWVNVDHKILNIPIFNLSIWPKSLFILLLSLLAQMIDTLVRLESKSYKNIVVLSTIVTSVIQVILGYILLIVLPFWNEEFLSQVNQGTKIAMLQQKGVLDFWESSLQSYFIMILIVIGAIGKIARTIHKNKLYSGQ